MTTTASIAHAERVRDALAQYGTVERVESHRSPYSTSATIDELRVVFVGGAEMRLLYKDLSPAGVVPEARGVKPDFLWCPEREVHLYRSVLADAGLGTATCYAGAAGRHASWLLLEKVAGLELWQIGDFGVWQEVAASLPSMHRRLSAAVATGATVPFIRYNRAFYDAWPRRAAWFLRAANPSTRARLDWVTGVYAAAVDALLALPSTVIHGELYASNVLIGTGTAARRICPVDWEMAAIGPALMDVATLVSGWEEPERAQLIQSYVDAEAEAGAAREVVDRVDLCRLHLCLRSLGWSDGWRPPAEHARDWLGEAVVIAEGLRD